MPDIFSRLKELYSEEDLLHFEEVARGGVKESQIPGVTDYLVAILMLQSMANSKILEYRIKEAREKLKDNEWPDEIEKPSTN